MPVVGAGELEADTSGLTMKRAVVRCLFFMINFDHDSIQLKKCVLTGDVCMPDQDVRWRQRLAHFSKALAQLREANALAETRPLSKLEQQGMIKAFEFTYELAWNTLKDFLENQGVQDLFGARAVIRASFKAGLIGEADLWMNMIVSRNLTSHTDDEDTAAKILVSIREDYSPLFDTLERRMQMLCDREDG